MTVAPVTAPAPPTSADPARRAAMGALARASRAELAAFLARVPEAAGARDLRAPAVGLVMLRGRVGGDGAPFNLAEATVTRAAVALPCGAVGHAHALGRERARARLAAVADALWCRADLRGRVEEELLAPLRARLAAEAALRARRAAATRVEFSTLARGEDAA